MCLLALLLAACGGKANEANAPATQTQAKALSDKKIESFRTDLLELAFQAGSAIPPESDLTDRSRRQHEAFEACLELDQPVRARQYAEQIKDWRRGVAYAQFAAYLAEHGQPKPARELIATAEELAQGAKRWRKDRILRYAAQARLWLDEPAEAQRLRERIEAQAETGKLELTQVRIGKVEFDKQMKQLDALAAIQEFDARRNAIEGYLTLYERSADNAERRTLLEGKIKATYARLPHEIRIDTLRRLAEACTAISETEKASGFLDEAQEILTTAPWQQLDLVLRLRARLAATRAKAGDVENARKSIQTTLKVFDAQKKTKLLTVEWASVVREIAEACQEMGDKTEALEIYRKAVEEGSGNVNGRCRANDLSQTCVSMALHGAEPDEELWARMREILKGLEKGLW